MQTDTLAAVEALPLTKDYFCLNYCKTDDCCGQRGEHLYKEDVWGFIFSTG